MANGHYRGITTGILWVLLLAVLPGVHAEVLTSPNGEPPQPVTLVFGLKTAGPVDNIALSNDGTLLAVGRYSRDDEYEISIWSMADGKRIGVFGNLFGSVLFQISPDNAFLFAGSLSTWGTSNAIWRIRDGTLVSRFEHAYDDWQIHPVENTLYAVEAGRLEIYQLPDMVHLATIEDVIGAPTFSRGGRLFAARIPGGLHGHTAVWRTRDNTRLFEIREKFKNKRLAPTYDFSPDNRFLAVGHYKGIDIWHVDTGEHVRTIGRKMEKGRKRSASFPLVRFSESGRHLLATYLDVDRRPGSVSIRLWDAETGSLIDTYVEEMNSGELIPWFGSFSPGLGIIALKFEEESAGIWRLEQMNTLFGDGHSTPPATTGVVVDITHYQTGDSK